MKRLVSLLLAALLLLGLPLPALAEDSAAVMIGTAEEFIDFAKNCSRESYSLARRFVLTADIDLSGREYEPAAWFAGSFDGRNHVIRGLDLQAEGSRLGLFRQIAPGATVENLSVEGQVRPGGSREYIGGLAGVNEGTIRSCRFTGEVRGVRSVGGLVGLNAAGGSIDACRTDAIVLGEHQVGGVAGNNEGMLTDCESRSEVNTSAVEPSGETSFDLASFSQEDFVNLSDIGGVAGENTGALLRCRNKGPVGYRYTGYNVGGVAGKSSGFVDESSNTGAVEGRRDVGGIVGQMIPYAAWELSGEKLQELSDAISYMQYLLNTANQNADEHADVFRGHLQTMNGYSAQALYALAELLRANAGSGQAIIDGIRVDEETGQIRFPELQFSPADTSDLTAALNNMYAQSGLLADDLGDTIGTAAEDIRNISYQMGYIFNLLFALTGEGTGQLITTRDLSLEEAYEHDEGAVARSVNHGTVRAETNAGGVVGSIAFEIAFDMEDRLNASGFLVTNAEQFLFAAVRASESRGRVQSRGDCAGGVVGRMEIGAAVDCVASGEALSQNGDYVGGVAGLSQGSLRGCWARCSLEGRRYIGGVAGLGKDLQSCRAWTHIARGAEYQGAVAGWAEGLVEDNLYVDSRPDGVDGVSRIGQAEAVSSAAFLALEGAPADFETVTVRFVAEGKTVQTLELPFGSAVKSFPQVAKRGGASWVWDDFDLSHVYSDMEIGGSYLSPDTTIASGEDVPQFLVEGEFYGEQALQIVPYSVSAENGEEWNGYILTVEDYTGPLTVRMRSEPSVKLLTPVGNDWAELAAERDGQYLVFSLPNGGAFVCVSTQETPPGHLLAFLAGLLLLLLLLVRALVRRRRKQRNKDK